MNPWRFIISGARQGAYNMALDEAVFLRRCEDLSLPSVIRVYTWERPCVTIGYFQKYGGFENRGMPVLRRLTGGLAVSHAHDVSYSVVTAEPDWPEVFDQEKTYFLIHRGIREGLAELGIQSEFYTEPKTSSDISLCVATLFPHDLLYQKRKLVGSSQRRRGKVLLQQGSLHVTGHAFPSVASALCNGWQKTLGITFNDSAPDPGESALCDELLREKYADESWNRKF